MEKIYLSIIMLVFATGCTTTSPVMPLSAPALTPVTGIYRDLISLPEPAGKIVAAVYGFRDQTGQYKSSPNSYLSTSVTQGGASIILKAMKDSGWFIPVEREGLQDLLNERKVARVIDAANPNSKPVQLPNLISANVILEGAIVGYESNVKTGGGGLKYFGYGASGQYRVDQVTVNLRSVDVRTGQVLNSVSTTKTIYSQEVSANLYRFVSYKSLLQGEAGYTENEPAQLCVADAIQAALIHLVLQGVRDGVWMLKNSEDINSPLVQAYLKEQAGQAIYTPEPEQRLTGFN